MNTVIGIITTPISYQEFWVQVIAEKDLETFLTNCIKYSPLAFVQAVYSTPDADKLASMIGTVVHTIQNKTTEHYDYDDLVEAVRKQLDKVADIIPRIDYA